MEAHRHHRDREIAQQAFDPEPQAPKVAFRIAIGIAIGIGIETIRKKAVTCKPRARG
jgi:hypothetical protein